MHEYKAKTFNLPEVEGISKKQLDAHIKLYEGYVKHANIITQEMMEFRKSKSPNKDYMMRELWRRYSFEFNGMRLHEYYFGALVGAPKARDPKSRLSKKLEEWGDSGGHIENIIKFMAGIRGSGWILLIYDKYVDKLNVIWVDEHHLGHLASVDIILAVDCWEHAYMIDHDTTGRGAYVEAYLEAINWSVPEKWFDEVAK